MLYVLCICSVYSCTVYCVLCALVSPAPVLNNTFFYLNYFLYKPLYINTLLSYMPLVSEPSGMIMVFWFFALFSKIQHGHPNFFWDIHHCGTQMVVLMYNTWGPSCLWAELEQSSAENSGFLPIFPKSKMATLIFFWMSIIVGLRWSFWCIIHGVPLVCELS